jgi:carbamoyl-phosphate synthase large subunit
MPRQNILLLSAGRRVELYQAIADAAARLLPTARIICADMEPELSAACVACGDHAVLPPVRDPGYRDALAALCRDRDIGMVIPTIDTELMALAEMREAMQAEGTELVVSDVDLIRQCSDKRLTAALFTEHGIATPEIYGHDSIRFPCFSKPAAGSSSVGACRIDDRDQISGEMWSDPGRMFMELVPSDMVEFTIDLYYDRNGALKCIVPRERIATRAGEVAKGVTRRNWIYDYVEAKVGQLDGARGCLTLQVFADASGSRIAAIEINPRFGGGVPLTFAAGADYPAWLVQEYFLDEEIPYYADWEPDLLMLRYDAKTLTRNFASHG